MPLQVQHQPGPQQQHQQQRQQRSFERLPDNGPALAEAGPGDAGLEHPVQHGGLGAAPLHADQQPQVLLNEQDAKNGPLADAEGNGGGDGKRQEATKVNATKNSPRPKHHILRLLASPLHIFG